MRNLGEKSELTVRRERLWSTLAGQKLHAFLTTALPNLHYLSGFTGSNGALLLYEDRALLFTDPRYATQAPQQSDCEVKIATGPLTREIAKWTRRLKVKTLGFEQNRISFEEHGQLKASLPGV